MSARLHALRRHRWTPLELAAAATLALLLALVVLGPSIWGEQARRVNTDALLQGSSAVHPLGTDSLGRDILARVLVAARLSLGLALLSILLALAIGVPAGCARAVLGPRGSRWLASTIDLLIALPAVLVAIVLAVMFGVGARGAVLAIGCASAPSIARLTMTLTDRVVATEYFDAARILGVGRLRLVLRHVLPNVGEPLIVNATIAVGQALLVLSGLSFLGLGVQPPSYDWGRLLSEGLGRIYVSALPALGPGVAIVIAGLAFNLLGEAAAQALGGRGRVRARRGGELPVAPSAAVPAPADPDTVLEVEHLSVRFELDGRTLVPVCDVSFRVQRGEIVGIVGESGSGKSLSALALARLTPPAAQVSAEHLRLLGRELLGVEDRKLRAWLGTSVAMVFQDPGTALNPALRVGRQLVEVPVIHQGVKRRAARERAADKLRSLAFRDPERGLRQFPHQLSGGMRQRAVLGMALMPDPALIVADEPTTALDATVQQQVLELLARVNADTGASILFISHDIGAVAQICTRVLVMYCGRIVEELATERLLHDAAHPYTRALIASLPTMTTDRTAPLASIPGRPPEPVEGLAGCSFAPRCPAATERCLAETPPLEALGPGHAAACWHPVAREAGGTLSGQARA